MAMKKTAALADVPFYDYLWQFYVQNRRKIRSVYAPLTRKFLDFNNPGENGKEAFLRQPQFEALEMYVFLKEYCENAVRKMTFILGSIFKSSLQISKPLTRPISISTKAI